MVSPERESRSAPLARAYCGRELVITRIVFDEVRRACDALGLREGSRLCCAAHRDDCVLLGSRGEDRCLPRHLAHFVEVAPGDSMRA